MNEVTLGLSEEDWNTIDRAAVVTKMTRGEFLHRALRNGAREATARVAATSALVLPGA